MKISTWSSVSASHIYCTHSLIDVAGRFLYNNYRQCLSIIEEFSVDVAHLQQSLHLDDAAIEAWLSDERNFLKNLKDEPEERVLECAYVQALIDREHAE